MTVGAGAVTAALTVDRQLDYALPIHLIGPVVGAATAALTYDRVARPRDAERVAERPQGTHGDIEGRS